MPTTLTKIICGVHITWESANIVVTGTPADPAPPVTIIPRVGSPTTEPYDSGDGNWSFKLDAGDYLLKIEVPDTAWFTGTVQIAVTDQTDIIFVYHGGETVSPNAHVTVAWTDSTAIAGGDPKDPWPPPGANTVSLPSVSQSWHDTQLHSAAISLVTPKAL